ncbi:MAG: GGDEF domain-containing protein [Oscillospiraceae bacterium]|nr:GGDEF domain-containing protein [Oscillospiraceae bacterium]
MIFKRPKRIGFVMAYPESMYQQMMLDAACSVCETYGYDLVVWTMLVQTCHYFKDYLEGELNIYELMNFDKVDAVVVNTISLTENGDFYLVDNICEKIRSECRKPVTVLDLPMGDYPLYTPDETAAFERITAHVLDIHRTKKVLVLAGNKGNPVCVRRIQGIKDEYSLRGMRFDENNIVWGDFWYTSGKALADEIVSGKRERPDAVICLSDHMAIGLSDTLKRYGFAPGDICITGYDAATETVMYDPTVTSYIPDVTVSVHKAINDLRSQIDPGLPIIQPRQSKENGLRLGARCGCQEDAAYIRRRLFSSMWQSSHHYGIDGHLDEVDLCKLLDGYTFESLTAAEEAEEGIKAIYAADWLLRPYQDFWLCLDPEWLDTEKKRVSGYPDKMDIVIHTVPTETLEYGKGQYYDLHGGHRFDTKDMIPALDESHEPSVFYFVPIHFSRWEMGYAVLRNPVGQKKKISYVFHNWIRNVNNGLEMIRSKNRLDQLAKRDQMTGLYNRRGMAQKLAEMQERASDGDEWIAVVIDMDGLKFVNDNYGHSEGDYGINAVAAAARGIADAEDIVVRAGGDEFYIIGVGKYDEDVQNSRKSKFTELLAKISASSGKEYPIKASIGFAHGPVTATPDGVLSEADVQMYANKMSKKHRSG